jgi:hypothetical protein
VKYDFVMTQCDPLKVRPAAARVIYHTKFCATSPPDQQLLLLNILRYLQLHTSIAKILGYLLHEFIVLSIQTHDDIKLMFPTARVLSYR